MAIIKKTSNKIKFLSKKIIKWIERKYFSIRFSELYKYTSKTSNFKGTVLFWVPGGLFPLLNVEASIAAALKLRGINVHAIICDGMFKACAKREISQNIPLSEWSKSCTNCIKENREVLDKMKIPYSFIGDFVSEGEKEKLWEKAASYSLNDFFYNNINIDKNIKSTIIRYLKGNPFEDIDKNILREYAFSGLIVVSSASKAIKEICPEMVFMSHGIYVDWGPALQVAVGGGIPVTVWHSSYLNKRLYFRSVEESKRISLHIISNSAWNLLKKTELTCKQNNYLEKFFNDRYRENIRYDNKFISFNRLSLEQLDFRKKYDIDNHKAIWAVMAHLNWDAVTDYSPMLYDSFDEWILETIKEIIKISNVTWLIKIHPVEAYFSPESGIQNLINKHFPILPEHIKVVSATEEINSFDFFNLINGGITVYGTAGLELALAGKPVILAGEAHYGRKGFTYDSADRDSYKELLHKACFLGSLNKEQMILARKYAYCHFIQRQIPVPVIDMSSEWYKFEFHKRYLLLPGKDPFIDFICNRIIDKNEFIMDDNLTDLSQREF